MELIHLFKELYAYCTDFVINFSNITGLSYYEVNFIIFILLYPFLLFVTPIIYFIQKRRLAVIRKKTMTIPTKTQYYFNDIKTFSKRKIFISSNLAWILLAVLMTIAAAKSDTKQMEQLEQEIRMNPTENRDTDLHASGMGTFLTFSFSLMFFVPLNLFIFLTTRKTNLPTKLFVKVNLFDISVILWELFFAFWIAITFLFFLIFTWFGHYIESLIILFFIFILLNLRAGQISKYKQTSENASL